MRLVERTAITPRADEACGELDGFSFCPNFPDSVPSGALTPDGVLDGPLCRCPAGDGNAPSFFRVFVEDPDLDDDGRPADQIFGALLLDYPPGTTDPAPFLAYTSFLSPDEPARLDRAADATPIGRPDANLKTWTLGALLGTLDLCNNNDGAQLDAGLHELRLIVTDRPWYQPYVLDADGNVERDGEGEPLRLEPVIGVPDVAVGATYSTKSFVFRCNEPSEEVECNCLDPEEDA